MVTRSAKCKPRIRHSASLKDLENGARAILKLEGQPVFDLGPSMYLVRSMSTDEYRTVRHLGGLWECDCPYKMAGHAQCKHICAVRMMLKMREKSMGNMSKTHVNAPEIKCPECDGHDFHESTSYETGFGESIVYMCDDPECKYRFTYRPGFKKKWFSDAVITDALLDAGAGHPPARIVERMEKNGIDVSERTIRRWIAQYSELVERFTSTLQYTVGDEWSLDEKHLKTHPKLSEHSKKHSKKRHWLAATLDNKTDIILAYEVTDNKSAYDATNMLKAATKVAGKVPDVTIADKLSGYKKGFINAIQSINPAAILIADVAINGVHLNNNKRERLNGELLDCLYRARGFWLTVPGLVRMTIMYNVCHNFIHEGARGTTPAEAAGVFVAGRDKIKTLIQNTAPMATWRKHACVATNRMHILCGLWNFLWQNRLQW